MQGVRFDSKPSQDGEKEKKKRRKKEKTRIDVYETLCPQQMLVHKGGKFKNWGGECRDVTPTKLQSQNIFKESTGGGAGSRVGGVRMDVNEELNFLRKFQKKIFFFLGGGGSGGGGGVVELGGIRMDVNEELN